MLNMVAGTLNDGRFMTYLSIVMGPVLVEAKQASDTRRADARLPANGVAYWPIDRIIGAYRDCAATLGVDPDSNLRSGRMRPAVVLASLSRVQDGRYTRGIVPPPVIFSSSCSESSRDATLLGVFIFVALSASLGALVACLLRSASFFDIEPSLRNTVKFSFPTRSATAAVSRFPGAGLADWPARHGN